MCPVCGNALHTVNGTHGSFCVKRRVHVYQSCAPACTCDLTFDPCLALPGRSSPRSSLADIQWDSTFLCLARECVCACPAAVHACLHT